MTWTHLPDSFLGAADSKYAQSVEAKVLEVPETGLYDLRDTGLPLPTADVRCGPTGQGIEQAWYAACHPISRRH